MNTKTLDQIKNEYYGEVGAPERDRLERELEALRIGFKIRSAREKLDMTQAELASRIDKKRTFISKVEKDRRLGELNEKNQEKSSRKAKLFS